MNRTRKGTKFVLPFLLFPLLGLWACTRSSIDMEDRFPRLMEIPEHFPAIPCPDDNSFSLEKWELGKQLFFDPAMSLDSSVSCASCHIPGMSFTDGLPQSIGIEGRIGKRNSPSLANVAYHPYYTREGGVPSLEMHVLVPLQEHDEFDFNIVLLSERLNRDNQYISMAQKAYGRSPDPFVITRALAVFERSLISGNSPYDRYLLDDDPEQMSPAALRGMVLFFSSRTQCGQCHNGFNFTNYTLENNGLYPEYSDPGRYRLTGLEEDRARFKVPSLRNVSMTGPYMHDGSMSSLTEVVAHYNSGGASHPNKSPLIRELGLSPAEQSDLVAFLESLTDRSFTDNPLFQKK